MIICVCLFLFGCTSQKNEEPVQAEWTGDYQNEDISLNIHFDDDYPDGIAFEFEKQGEIFDHYAYFDTDDKMQAIYDADESGHTLTFSLRYDRIIVKEINGVTFEETSLTGQYIKK